MKHGILGVVFLMLIACAGKGGGSQDTRLVMRDIQNELSRQFQLMAGNGMGFDFMRRLQVRAQANLVKGISRWPAGTSWSLSAMEDHVVVFVVCKGKELEKAWRP